MNHLRMALPVVLLAVLAFAGACGGSGGLSLEEYFKRLDEIDNRSAERSDALQDQLNLISDETAPDQERIDAAQSTFPEFATIVDEFFESVDKLEPPKEARENHQEAVDAAKAVFTFFDDISADVAGAESLAELDQALSVLNSSEASAANQGLTDACLTLQRQADDNNIDVNLECGQ